MESEITFTNSCSEQEFLSAVRMNLLQENIEKTNGKLKIPDLEYCCVARNKQGDIVGGIQGATFLSAVEVEVLWVQEAYRGKGIATHLLTALEQEAKNAGCKLAYVTTYSFQAPIFYQKQGYTLCGEVNGFPDDIKLYTLQKMLAE